MNKARPLGFGVAELLMVVAVVVAIGAIGYYVYSAQTKTNESKTNNQVAEPESQTAESNSGYLVVKEWNIKIKLTDAEKVTYEISKDELGTELIGLKVKSEYLQDATCDVSVGLARTTAVDPELEDAAKKIGDYYYTPGGSPYNCENDADNALNESVRKEFELQNITAL